MVALRSSVRSSAWSATALVFMAHWTWRQLVAPKLATTFMALAVNAPDALVVTFRRPTELQVWSSAEVARHCITKSWMLGR